MIDALEGFMPAQELKKKISLSKNFFYVCDSEHFEIKKAWGKWYVKPSREIMNLLNKGYIGVPLKLNEADNDFDYVIKLKKRKLGFWR